MYRATKDLPLRRMLMINGSRWDLIDENKPFATDKPIPPGRNLYPPGLTREQIEAYVKDHPGERDAIYSPYTVLRWNGKKLDAIPYHVEYRKYLQPAAKLLEEAADLSDDKNFANFLRLRSKALLTDDYYPSDLAWLDLRNPKIDVIFAPYETYLDDVLGVKTSYGTAVMVRNDPRVHQAKGSKKIFFKNFMDARTNFVVLPLAKYLMPEAQAAQASGEGYLAVVV